MISLETFKELSAALPGTAESLHFGRIMFGVGKKNFASFDPRKGELALLLSLADPARAAAIEQGLAEPAPGKYGQEGWTTVDLERMDKRSFRKFLESAHSEVWTPESVSGSKKPSTGRRIRGAL